MGIYSVILFNNLTAFSGLANLVLFPAGLGESKVWYRVGLAAALAHFGFVPLVMGPVNEIVGLLVKRERNGDVEQADRGKAEEAQRRWVGVHRLRMLSVDLVAWGSFAWGVVGLFAGGL